MLAIMEKNGIVDQNKIFAGQILELPNAAEIVANVAAARARGAGGGGACHHDGRSVGCRP